MKHLIYQNGGESISAIIAEKGEVYRDVTGKLNKIDNKAPSHDSTTLVVNNKQQSAPKGKGGIVLHDVTQILSASQNQVNTGKRNNSIRDEIISISSDETKEFAKQFGIELKHVRKQSSPSQLFEDLKRAKDKLGLKIGNKADNTNITSNTGQTSYQANMAQVNALPTDDELFDNVFKLQESKKEQSNVDFDSQVSQYGGERQFLGDWFKNRANYDISKLNPNISENTAITDINLRSKRPNSVIEGYYDNRNNKIVLNKNAHDKESTLLHELSHAAQYNGLPNFDYQRIVPRNVMAQEIGNDDYLLNPKEVHSRLMQYRRDSNLSPMDIIDSSFPIESDGVDGELLMQLNDAKRTYFKNNNSYIDYAIRFDENKTLKDTLTDTKLIQQLRDKGIRGDIPYSKLTPEQKEILDNTTLEYDDKAAFDLFQQNPDFDTQFLKSKGVKMLRNPQDYNLPANRNILETILNGLTSNNLSKSNQVKFGGSVEESDAELDYESIMGYRDDSPLRFNTSNQINSSMIDMSKTGTPLLGISNTGDTQMLQPYSGITEFDGDSVTEFALSQYGGKSKYNAQQIKYFRENNARLTAQVQRGLDWLRNNPNASVEDKNRIQGEIEFLKKDIVSLSALQDPIKRPVLKNTDLPKNIKNSKKDPSDLGEIPTDPVIKNFPRLKLDAQMVKPKGATGVVIGERKMPEINFTADKNPIAQKETDIEESLLSFSDKDEKPRLPAGITEDIDNNKGLQWYDVAGDIMSIIDSRNRTSPILQQVNLPRVNLVRPDSGAQVGAIRQNFLTALDSLKTDNDTTSAANINQLMTNANQQMQQAIAQGQQISADVQNKEETINQQIIADETLRNLSLREDFTKKVLMTDEAQRKQSLTSFQNIFDKIAKSNRFNKTEEAFRSVFAKNFRINNNGRIEFSPDNENNPIFSSGVANNILTPMAQQQDKKSIKKK